MVTEDKKPSAVRSGENFFISRLFEMDWNAKWDWESLVLFNPKTAEIPKQLMTNWGIEDGEGTMGMGTFRPHEGKGSSSGSGRSSLSVCTDSSFKEVMENTQVAFGNINVFSEDISGKEDFQRAEHDESPSVGSGESLIGLKLGKRMYFENNGCTKTASLPEIPVSSIDSTVKKIKSSNLNTPSRCQVEGCNLDLSSAKEYHRKHKVCGSHSKCPKVVVGGLERRFCQQCSRFHSLSEFDEKKRSCRRRLSDHNARRRKPQIDQMQFNTMRLPLPLSAFTCADGKGKMGLMSSNVHPIYSRSSSDSTWESSFSSKFTASKGCLLKFGETGGLDEQLQLAGTQSPLAISLPGHSFNRPLPSKGTKSETLTRGFKESVLPPNLDLTPDFHHSALSLLSNDTSWDSFSPSNISPHHSVNVNRMHYQPLMQGYTQSFLQTSSELCQTDHHFTNRLTATANDTSHFQLFKEPFENALYSNPFD